jgi:hypothetical protein
MCTKQQSNESLDANEFITNLPVVRADVKGHLVLDDDLSDVLDAGAHRGRSSDVHNLINLKGIWGFRSCTYYCVLP